MRKVVLGLVVLSSFAFASDDIYYDSSTGMSWQDNEEAATVKKTWVTSANWKAKNYLDTSGDTATTYCKNLTLAGHSDWRLPTKTELKNLYDDSRGALKHVSSLYWSSYTTEYFENFAWSVDFGNGFVGNDAKGDNLYVRCVRAGQ